jgi:hypothetical protein
MQTQFPFATLFWHSVIMIDGHMAPLYSPLKSSRFSAFSYRANGAFRFSIAFLIAIISQRPMISASPASTPGLLVQ